MAITRDQVKVGTQVVLSDGYSEPEYGFITTLFVTKLGAFVRYWNPKIEGKPLILRTVSCGEYARFRDLNLSPNYTSQAEIDDWCKENGYV